MDFPLHPLTRRKGREKMAMSQSELLSDGRVDTGITFSLFPRHYLEVGQSLI